MLSPHEKSGVFSNYRKGQILSTEFGPVFFKMY